VVFWVGGGAPCGADKARAAGNEDFHQKPFRMIIWLIKIKMRDCIPITNAV